ncbi:aromatic prenyltransferase [Aspergillus steynii IBT 23096]|uniref:Aromatic prenyltransferase n=1 Tax=Aspergillus steynii IBT 23096 TaxID=1392250 RepID=A0A2I2GDJ3_9EURO|nr:aromatic prenyltransferase [Aspergillus steynii IBT 23096]PLB50942.1 aromatic prenyltransferase [Aspergillus steynii IBT 23096]
MAYTLLRPCYSALHPTAAKLLSLFSFWPSPSPLRSLTTSSRQSPTFQRVTTEVQSSLDSHGEYWWHTSGLLLSALLDEAGYSTTAQHRILTFFGRTIAPSLGPTYIPGAPQWHSFMTDDHHPIELSWDWHTGHKSPTVRFSVEPVGIDAGTPVDPDNRTADASFRTAMTAALPDAHMAWFEHFDRELTPTAPTGSMEGHPSKLFYAFDLSADAITSKAYFFPGFVARATSQSNLQVMSDAIARAPGCCSTTTTTPASLAALHTFHDFARDPLTPPLEMDMLAIDMDPPALSRLKIYFRNRATDFASVRQMMTLGGRIPLSSDMVRGLQNLRRLWDAVFEQSGMPDSHPLGSSTHRTNGLLYNVEFRPGSPDLKVKIYMPARHYARCDDHVLSAIRSFMATQVGANPSPMRGGGGGGDFASVMRRMCHPDALQDRGLHTYIGCSVQKGGDLRVVSYVNGQGPKLLDSVSASGRARV